MRKKIFTLFLLGVFVFPLSAFAEGEPIESEVTDVPSVQEVNQVIEYNLQFDKPIATYEVNPDDFNGSNISSFAVNGDVYSGSYNTTIISLWNGLLSNNVGRDYVAWRGGQYDYYIFFGEDFSYSNGVFSGSGTCYHYNTYGNRYSYEITNDSFRVNPANNYLYTNVSEGFPALETERSLLYEQIQTITFIALLGFSVLRWIFIGK